MSGLPATVRPAGRHPSDRPDASRTRPMTTRSRKHADLAPSARLVASLLRCFSENAPAPLTATPNATPRWHQTAPHHECAPPWASSADPRLAQPGDSGPVHTEPPLRPGDATSRASASLPGLSDRSRRTVPVATDVRPTERARHPNIKRQHAPQLRQAQQRRQHIAPLHACHMPPRTLDRTCERRLRQSRIRPR